MDKQNYFLLTHDWNFANGEVGHYELCFSNLSEARSRFEYLKLLIETDDYDFDAHFTPFAEDDTVFSVYEDANSLVNRQDLVLRAVPYGTYVNSLLTK